MTVLHGEKAWLATLLALASYLALVALGRFLKRRAHMRLGVPFQIFALSLAGFIALKVFALDVRWLEFRLRREMGALAVLFGVFFVVALFDRVVWSYYYGQRRQTEIPKFLRDLFLVVVLTGVGLVILRAVYQQPITGVLAGSGIAAIVLGLALQDLLGNIIAGIALQIEQPFKSGDWLLVEGMHACVIEINWRSTRLRTLDEICLDIPNSQISKSTVTNFSYPTAQHAMHVSLGIHYDTSPNEAKDVLFRATLNAAGVLAEPPPRIFLKEFGESSIIYDIKFWIADHATYLIVAEAIRVNVWYGLRRNKITIPYPIRTLEIERKSAAHAAPRPPAGTPEALRKHAFFQCLSEAEMQTLLLGASPRLHGRRETLITQGADGDSMFVLIKGTAEVFVQHEGNPTRVAALGPGDVFGENSLLTGEKRSATVIAQTDCEVLRIDKPLFSSVLAQNPDLLRSLSAMLADRLLQNEAAFIHVSAIAGEAQAAKYRANFLSKLRSFFEL